MEITNRFALLGLLLVEEEPNDSSFADLTSTSKTQIINEEENKNNYWNVPDYISKPILHRSVHTSSIKKSVTTKTSESFGIGKNITEKNESKPSSMTQFQNQTVVCSYYPPQPYKIKQKQSSKQSFVKISFS